MVTSMYLVKYSRHENSWPFLILLPNLNYFLHDTVILTSDWDYLAQNFFYISHVLLLLHLAYHMGLEMSSIQFRSDYHKRRDTYPLLLCFCELLRSESYNIPAHHAWIHCWELAARFWLIGYRY